MLKEEESQLLHTGPDTLAGRYLRNYWQPVYRAKDLQPGQTVPIQIMSDRFTLYRGEGGAAHLVAFRCAHRGTQLSSGWVEDDCIRCLYHGWKYESSGQCVEQPGEDEGFAAKIKIASYPLQEYLGLVFAYLGPGDPPPLRHYPDFDRPGVVVTMTPELWPCNYWNRLDNDPDGFHVLFTHRESIGRMGRLNLYEERRLSVEETEYGLRTRLNMPDRPPEYLHAIMPNVNTIRVRTGVATSRDDVSVWEDRMTWAVPVTDEQSLRFEVNHVRLDGEAAEAYRERYARQEQQLSQANAVGDLVLTGKLRIPDIDPNASSYELFRVEDYATEVGQGTIADRSDEHLGREDMGVILRRKQWLRELKALAEGRPLTEWVIPAGLTEMTPEDYAGIPSAARR
ncbi:MAG TPA: Rieske 2Fe-2S domain-containing protein [Chloroflexota bacterium]|nr:Rieske 2Fe-2S domain-containing protein [Chloroflexota bacterium]